MKTRVFVNRESDYIRGSNCTQWCTPGKLNSENTWDERFEWCFDFTITKQWCECVWIKDHKIGIEGAKALSEMLKINTTLTQIFMNSEFQWMRHKKVLMMNDCRWVFKSESIWVRWRKDPHRSMGKTKWKSGVEVIKLADFNQFFLSQITNSFFGFFLIYSCFWWKWVWNVVQWRIRFSFPKGSINWGDYRCPQTLL